MIYEKNSVLLGLAKIVVFCVTGIHWSRQREEIALTELDLDDDSPLVLGPSL